MIFVAFPSNERIALAQPPVYVNQPELALFPLHPAGAHVPIANEPIIPYFQRYALLTQHYDYSSFFLKADLPLETLHASELNRAPIVELQVTIEVMLESELLKEGFTPDSIISHYGQIRECLWGSKIHTVNTSDKYLKDIISYGTRNAPLYKTLFTQIEDCEILLDRLFYRRG